MTEPPNSNPLNLEPNGAAAGGGNDARGFDESLLSGYLDGELTQSDRQKVALHLEDDQGARELYEQLRETRQAALTTPFPKSPADDLWDEAPRSMVSRVLLYLGLTLLAVAFLGGVSLWLLAANSSGADLKEMFWIGMLPVAAVLGTVSVLASVTLDRLVSRRHDIYRFVQK